MHFLSRPDNNKSSPEYTHVELPFIRQLQALGWDYLEGDTGVPYLTERENFRQVLLTGRLRQALVRINLDENGEPWLDETRVAQAVGRLERLGKPKLIETNQVATDLLLKGTPIEGPDGRNVTVRYIDFEHPEGNDFLVINQFRVDPPWATAGRDYVVPDLVLFVNGIPLIVVEAKNPDLEDPLTQAITQLLRYSNQREGVDESEGAERLFHYAQLMVATCFETARVGTVGASYEHYLEWKDTYPASQTLGVSENPKGLSGQQMLVTGMLRPVHLLDIVRNFTLFTEVAGQTVKIVPRYQQFRAVHKAIERLTHGQTRRELALSGAEGHGEADQRGGIIWHTQGSGKSLTMVFLVRKMRTLPELRRFKVVAVTDRIKLEKQLRDTATLTSEPLQVAGSVDEFQRLLRRPVRGMAPAKPDFEQFQPLFECSLLLALPVGQTFGHIQRDLAYCIIEQADDLPHQVDNISQMPQLQTCLFFVLTIRNIEVGQEELGLVMPSHHRPQLSWNVLGFTAQRAHAANQSVFADHDAQTVGPFAQFREGLIEQQEAGHFLAAVVQPL